jgi:hypothetical protein
MDARIEQALKVWPLMSNESRRRALAQQLGPEAWPVLLQATREPWLAELIAAREARIGSRVQSTWGTIAQAPAEYCKLFLEMFNHHLCLNSVLNMQ